MLEWEVRTSCPIETSADGERVENEKDETVHVKNETNPPHFKPKALRHQPKLYSFICFDEIDLNNHIKSSLQIK